MNTGRYTCPACGFVVFEEPPGSRAVCPVCRWRDNHIELAFPLRMGLTHLYSFADYQQWRALKRVPLGETKAKGFVRDSAWRPLSDRERRRAAELSKGSAGPVVIDDSRSLYYWLHKKTGWLRRTKNASELDPALPLEWRLERVSRMARDGCVLLLLWSRKNIDPTVAQKAEEALDTTLRELSAENVVRLDAEVRLRFRHYVFPWPEELLDVEPNSTATQALKSCHPSGYVRADAIKRLSASAKGCEIPFLLVRANDWVAPVRRAAYEALDSRITIENSSTLVRYLGLLHWLEEARRNDNRELVHRVRTFLKSDACRRNLLDGLSSPDSTVRSASFDLLLEAPAIDPIALAKASLESPHLLLRVKGARLVASQRDQLGFRELLHRMTLAGLPAVRRIAFEILLDGAEADRFVELALWDSDRTVRQLGQERARSQSLDLPAFYEATIETSQGRQLAAAVAGLGEAGDRRLAELVFGFLEHNAPSVRREALAALEALGDERFLDAALRALSDVSGTVSRRAAGILDRHATKVPLSDVWNVVASDAPFHCKRNALLLLRRFGKWTSGPWLVRACASEDTALREVAVSLVRRWVDTFNASFATPTGEQLSDLEAAVTRGEGRLPEDLSAALRFLIEATRRAIAPDRNDART